MNKKSSSLISTVLYMTMIKIPESTKRAVRLLKEKGHHLFIASGRSPFLIQPILEEIGLDSFIAYNGQYVMYEGEVIYGNPLKQELMDKIYETADQHDHPLVFMGEKTMKASVPNHPFIHEGIGTLKQSILSTICHSLKKTSFIKCCYFVKQKRNIYMKRSVKKLISSGGMSCLRMSCQKVDQRLKELNESLKDFRTIKRTQLPSVTG